MYGTSSLVDKLVKTEDKKMHLRKSVKTNTKRVTQKTGNVKINCLRKQCLKSDPLPCKGFNRFLILSAESNKFPKFDNSLEEYFFSVAVLLRLKEEFV